MLPDELPDDDDETPPASPAATVARMDQSGLRLDRWLATVFPEHSRSRLQALIKAGAVSIGGRPETDPAAPTRAGAEAVLCLPAAHPARPQPEPMPLVIVHEDADLIVIDKPAGLVVHPAAGHAGGTLVNALLAHCGASLSGIGGELRPGIVHRLDKDTSGLIVVAKTDRAHRGLAAQFADHGREGPLERLYLALVWGAPPRAGSIDAPLARHPRDRERMAIAKAGHGRWAVTHFTPGERFSNAAGEPLAALVSCRLETGRTHQIRVHMAHIGHPLLADPVYSAGYRTKAQRLDPSARAAVEGLRRQALHAAVLGFRHPASGATLRFESPLPVDLDSVIAALRARA